MADTLGLLPLPALAPDPTNLTVGAEGPAGDPLLWYVGDFVQKVCNAKLATVLAAVMPGTSFIANVAYYDPEDAGGLAFKDQLLPCLFVWRGEIEEDEWYAQDYLLSPSTIQCAWIPPKSDQPQRVLRHALLRAMHAAIYVPLEQYYGDAAWTDPSDPGPLLPDSLAGPAGSVFPVRAGVFSIDLGKFRRKVFKIDSLDGVGQQQKRPGISFTFAVKERLKADPSQHYNVGQGIQGNAINNAAPYGSGTSTGPLTMLSFQYGLTLAGLTPSSGPHAGGTSCTLMGTGIQPGATVTLGGVPVTGLAFPIPSIATFTTPPHAAGAVDLVVTNPAPNGSSAGNETATLPNAFTFT